MLVTGLNFVAVTAIVKSLGDRVPAAEAAFLRYALGLVFLIPMLRPMWRAQIGRTGWALFGLRGAAHTLGVMLWFFSMTQITIAEVTALNYMAPVYVTVGAALFLGERLAVRRIAAIAVALGGALLILRPGFRELDPGHIAMIVAAVAMGGSYLIAKRMSGLVSPAVVVGYLSVTVTIGLAPFAWAVWVPVTWGDLGLLFLVAAFATAGHYTMTLAFQAAPVAVSQPVTFLQLVWATLLGMLFFNEPPDAWVVSGGVLILGAVSFITWREARVKRRQVTPTDLATKV
ncbi:DMT family transporter [Actibacterium sp. 188UL27-1]|nr:DMT family transporter [Actibacterium sp. 188UL27-1]